MFDCPMSSPQMTRMFGFWSCAEIVSGKTKTRVRSTAANCIIFLIEKFIDGRELTVTVLDGKALPVVEIKPQNGWYDFTNKYTKGKTIYETPAKLSEKVIQEIQHAAENIFRALDCSVYSRVDFRYDGKDLYFLEVNTLPGMTPLSLTPMAAKAAGYSFGQLLEEIIRISLEKI